MDAGENLSPFVYWGQNKDRIFVKVDLKEVVNPEVVLTEDVLAVKASGLGLQGKNSYEFAIEFYLPIDAERSKYRVTARNIEFQIHKVGVGESWPRLTESAQKPAWLRIDFDHFYFEDSEDNEEDGDSIDEREKEIMRDLEHQLKHAEAEVKVDFRLVYMVLFNMFMWIGYSYVFFALLLKLWRYGPVVKKDAFSYVGDQLTTCQVVALMEVVHPLMGWVKTDVLQTVLQVGGRNLVLFGLIATEPKLQEAEPVFWLFVTWSSVELFRYPYYALRALKQDWRWVTWLRYTVWIPLYPLGFLLEGIILLLALPLFEKSGHWTVSLPNSANFAFHFPTFLKVYMLGFLGGMYLLMNRMYEQRKRKFGPTASRKTSTKKLS